MKKRLISLLLALCMVFSLCACAKDSAETVPDDNTDDKTVYVSKSGGKIHRYNDCSGMKYYDVMTYSEAIDEGFDLCQKCFG